MKSPKKAPQPPPPLPRAQMSASFMTSMEHSSPNFLEPVPSTGHLSRQKAKRKSAKEGGREIEREKEKQRERERGISPITHTQADIPL